MAEANKENMQKSLSGLIEEEPFARVFYQLVHKKKSGFLDIYTASPPKGKIIKRIIMLSGSSFFVQGGTPEEAISYLLVAKGKITKERFQQLKEQAGKDYKKLEELAQKEANLTPMELGELYQFQAELKIKNCLALVKGYFQFKELSPESLRKYPLVALNPERVLLEGIFTHYPRARIDKEFRGIEKKEFECADNFKEALERFGFGPKELRWLQSLNGKFSVLSVLRTSGIKPERALQIMVALYFTGYLRLPEGEEEFPLGKIYAEKPIPKKVEEKPKPEKKIEPKKKEEPKLPIEEFLDKELTDEELVREIENRLEIAMKKDSTYFDILGVDDKTPPSKIKQIYFKMAKIFHPDAKPDLYKGELRQKVEDLFTKISEAYNTLSDPELRRQYLDKLRSKVSEEELEKANRAIQAEMEFQKALILIRRGAFRDAFPVMEKVVSLMPDEPEYKIYLGYCIFKAEGISSARKARTMIEQALEQRPKVAEGWYYLGVINRVEGNLNKARECFERALELDRYHQEAQRELRVIQMKLTQEPKKKGGLFGRKK